MASIIINICQAWLSTQTLVTYFFAEGLNNSMGIFETAKPFLIQQKLRQSTRSQHRDVYSLPKLHCLLFK